MTAIGSLVNKIIEQLDYAMCGTFVAQTLQDLQLSEWPRGVSHRNFQRNPFLEPKLAAVRGVE
jgi:hypothetical protein